MKNFDKKMQDKLTSYNYDEAPSDASVLRMMDKLDEVLPIDSKVKPMYSEDNKKSSWGFMMKIAASITLLGVLGYLTFSLNQVNVVVGNRAHQEVTLPDGSNVILNSDSELSYNQLLWNFDRKVNLSGEAFFEVTKGERFSVVSAQGTTQVLGTSFNVFDRKKKYRVTCRTGRVSVTSATNRTTVMLNPGNAVTMQGNKIDEYEFDLKKITDWRQGEFFYSAERFEHVINELERQYDLQISYPDGYKSALYTGYFNNRNLEQSLKLICEPIELIYSINGNKIVLSESK